MTRPRCILPPLLLALSVQPGPLGSLAQINEQAVLSPAQPIRYAAELIDDMNPVPWGLVVLASLGTPPQTFRLFVDTLSEPLFVPRTGMDDQTGAPNISHFVPTQSSTFARPDPPRAARHIHGFVEFSGHVALDTFTVAGLDVARQPFLLAERARYRMMHIWFGWDGALGLSPRTRNDASSSSALLPSPWTRVMERGLLAQNLFTLEMPLPGVRRGEIGFGALSDPYAGHDFRMVPRVRDDDKGWYVPLRSFMWDNKTHPIRHEFDDRTARALITTDYFIALPRQWEKRVGEDVYVGCDLMHLACRGDMPDFVFGLGDHIFTLTAFQYAPLRRGFGRHEEWACYFNVFTLESLADDGGDVTPYAPATIVLGRPFLSAYYSVFDMDRKEIKRKPPCVQPPLVIWPKY